MLGGGEAGVVKNRLPIHAGLDAIFSRWANLGAYLIFSAECPIVPDTKPGEGNGNDAVVFRELLTNRAMCFGAFVLCTIDC